MKKKTLVQGPLGFQQTEETARHLEALLKKLPKDKAYQYRKKNTSSDVQFEPGERASIDIITTDSVDHEKEVVLPDGLNLGSYRKNPIVLYSHDAEKPIGKSLWIKGTLNGLKAKTLYATRPDNFEGDFLPDLVFALVQQSILKGRSIGFIPLVIDSPTPEQIKARPDWEGANVIISKSELFEYSIVSIPCNEDALQQVVSKGLKDFSTEALAALGLNVQAPIKETTVKPRPKPIDESKLAIKLLEKIQIDPDAIARQVIEALRTRGQI
jgi:phage head maturation protease